MFKVKKEKRERACTLKAVKRGRGLLSDSRSKKEESKSKTGS